MKLSIEVISICLGAAFGATLRYCFTLLSTAYIKSDFPWGTLFSNLIGCTLIGLLIGSGLDQRNEIARLGFGSGPKAVQYRKDFLGLVFLIGAFD